MVAILNLNDDTVCSSNPDFWEDELPGLDWDTRKIQIEGAKELCLECPVMFKCAEYAIAAKEPNGIWGGLSTADRAKLQK